MKRCNLPAPTPLLPPTPVDSGPGGARRGGFVLGGICVEMMKWESRRRFFLKSNKASRDHVSHALKPPVRRCIALAATILLKTQRNKSMEQSIKLPCRLLRAPPRLYKVSIRLANAGTLPTRSDHYRLFSCPHSSLPLGGLEQSNGSCCQMHRTPWTCVFLTRRREERCGV